MKRSPWFYWFVALWGGMIVAFVPSTNAAYPEKPIEIVVHSTPGSGSDLFTRTVAKIMEKEGIVKQKIQVSNRPGGGAVTAVNYLASKKGDPYVLMHTTAGPIFTVVRGLTQVKIEDLTLIAVLVEDPIVAFTRYDSPYKDMKSLIDAAKKAPNKINIAVATVGGSEHICAHRTAKAAGVKFNITPFKGGAEATVAILGGHVDCSFGRVNVQMGQIEGKKIRALAVLGEKRVPSLPDTPTMKELGIPAAFSAIRGFWGPPDFPPYAVQFWEEAFAKMLKTKEFRDYLQASQDVEFFLTRENFKKFLAKYIDESKKDVEELEIYKGKGRK